MTLWERGEKSFDLIQDIADWMAFDEQAFRAIQLAQDAIEEALWRLEEREADIE